MPNSRYVRGNRPRCKVRFTDLTGTGVDPAKLKFRYQTPDGTQVEYEYGTGAEIVREDAGEYYCDVPLQTDKQSAKFYCRWEAYDADDIAYAAAENVIEIISDYKEPQR